MMRHILCLSLLSTCSAADWVAFQDPIEQAFTMEVPKGWTARGGLFRLGYSDVRIMIDLTSPDGRVNVRMGDIAIPAYALPDQFHPREGEVVDLGAQAQMTVARYRSGAEYAALYARARFKSACSNPVSRKPDEGAPFQNSTGDAPGAKRSSDEAASQCDSNRVTYVYATTSLSQGIWVVLTLASFIAPADQAAMVRSITVHCSNSIKLAPQWREKQNQMEQEAMVYQRARQQ